MHKYANKDKLYFGILKISDIIILKNIKICQ